MIRDHSRFEAIRQGTATAGLACGLLQCQATNAPLGGCSWALFHLQTCRVSAKKITAAQIGRTTPCCLKPSNTHHPTHTMPRLSDYLLVAQNAPATTQPAPPPPTSAALPLQTPSIVSQPPAPPQPSTTPTTTSTTTTTTELARLQQQHTSRCAPCLTDTAASLASN